MKVTSLKIGDRVRVKAKTLLSGRVGVVIEAAAKSPYSGGGPWANVCLDAAGHKADTLDAITEIRKECAGSHKIC